MNEPKSGPSETEHQKAARIASEALSNAVLAGAGMVVVMVGMPDGSHHVSWSGWPFAIRGLAEVGIEEVRRGLREVGGAVNIPTWSIRIYRP